MSTEEILAERGTTHGWFPDHAAISQAIKHLLFEPDAALALERPRERAYDYAQQEGLEMIAHKLGRIVAGNPDEPDHWADIAGYARLVADHLERQRGPSPDEEPTWHQGGDEPYRRVAERPDRAPRIERPAPPAMLDKGPTACPDCGAPVLGKHYGGCPSIERLTGIR